MKINRRKFLKTSGFTLIGMIGLVNAPNQIFGADQIAGSRQFDSLLSQNADSFRRLLGTSFTIYTDDSAFTSELLEVKDYIPSKTAKSGQSRFAKKPETKSFRLIFSLPEMDPQQAYYQIYHPSIGIFNLMLVPGISATDQNTFTAVINRM